MSSGDASLVPGTPRLFAEHTGSALPTTDLDEYGFLEYSHRFFGFERLLEPACVLVVAPPWIGKSHTARRIDGFLRRDREAELLDQNYFLQLTNLEARVGSQPLEPTWWAEWQKRAAAEATWIIDSLEEGQRRESRGLCPLS